MIVRNDRVKSCVITSFTTKSIKMYSTKKCSINNHECFSIMFVGRYCSDFRLMVNKSGQSSRHLYISPLFGIRGTSSGFRLLLPDWRFRSWFYSWGCGWSEISSTVSLAFVLKGSMVIKNNNGLCRYFWGFPDTSVLQPTGDEIIGVWLLGGGSVVFVSWPFWFFCQPWR